MTENERFVYDIHELIEIMYGDGLMTKNCNFERFIYYPNSQMMIDSLTGEHYPANNKVCKLCNKLNRKADENVEEFDEWYKVLNKYRIKTPDKLDQVLMNERVW